MKFLRFGNQYIFCVFFMFTITIQICRTRECTGRNVALVLVETSGLYWSIYVGYNTGQNVGFIFQTLLLY